MRYVTDTFTWHHSWHILIFPVSDMKVLISARELYMIMLISNKLLLWATWDLCSDLFRGLNFIWYFPRVPYLWPVAFSQIRLFWGLLAQVWKKKKLKMLLPCFVKGHRNPCSVLMVLLERFPECLRVQVKVPPTSHVPVLKKRCLLISPGSCYSFFHSITASAIPLVCFLLLPVKHRANG